MAPFPRKLKELCTPAFIYFTISMIAIVLSVLQNLGSNRVYRFGSFATSVPSTVLIFLLKIAYVLFWTWILNLICKDGHKGIAWFLVLIPFILFFVIMGLVVLSPSVLEGMQNTDSLKKTIEKIKKDVKSALKK